MIAVLGCAPQAAFALSDARQQVVAQAIFTGLSESVYNAGSGDFQQEDQTAEANGGQGAVRANGSLRVIEDSETPTSVQQRVQNWSLLDLIMAVSCVILGLTLIAGGLITHVGDERPKRMPLRLLGSVPAIAAIVMFLTTQDLSLPMSLLDDMTLWFTLFTVLSITLALAATRAPSAPKLPDPKELTSMNPRSNGK
jgi:hypothetical protein